MCYFYKFFFSIVELTFVLTADKRVAHNDEGAMLTCKTNIKFPPFSMISFIKNGERVATSTSGLLQVDTKRVNANPFGIYICQLNASNVIYNKSISIKETGEHELYLHQILLIMTWKKLQ